MTSPLPSILNFRDVGKTINAFTGKKYVISNSLSTLHVISHADDKF